LNTARIDDHREKGYQFISWEKSRVVISSFFTSVEGGGGVVNTVYALGEGKLAGF
jgi:hypothetical protein